MNFLCIDCVASFVRSTTSITDFCIWNNSFQHVILVMNFSCIDCVTKLAFQCGAPPTSVSHNLFFCTPDGRGATKIKIIHSFLYLLLLWRRRSLGQGRGRWQLDALSDDGCRSRLVGGGRGGCISGTGPVNIQNHINNSS